jgi:L-threonylcarbamoyladenylate synthase
MRVDIDEAASFLLRSHPVAIPTETVWGLASRMEDETCVGEVFRLKKRPPKNPLIIHVNDVSFVKDVASFLPDDFFLLTETFWPGGLTLVLPVYQEKVPAGVRAGLPTAGFRMPNHAKTRELIERVGPLVAPSANLSGRPSATEEKHIEDDFGKAFPLLWTDVPPCDKGIESTILIWKKNFWYLGRLGAIDVFEIEKVLGYEILSLSSHEEAPLCPGQMYRHYAPRASLFLHPHGWKRAEAHLFDGVLGFADREYEDAREFVSIGYSESASSVANRLYSALRELDERDLSSVFVDMALSASKEWDSIRDRLEKAAREF